jgi:hypothetical protein
MSARHFVLLSTNPVDGREQEFNDWYDNVHIPDCLGTSGFVAGTRYKLSDRQANMGPSDC